MKSRGARAAASRDAGARGPTARASAIPLHHPAFLLALAACAASLVLSASYRLYDTDLWTLLTTGRAIWQHGIPRVDQWAWPAYGTPEVMASWLFRWRIWPLWERGGVNALFAWRWLTVLATFAFLWAAARRLGARGVLVLPILAWCGLVDRLRTDVRPEVAAAGLFALALWILETARARGSVRRRGENSDAATVPRGWRRLFVEPRVWLLPLACVWVNLHVSWYLLFALWALYLIDGRGGRPWLLVFLALAAVLVNPWGWRLAWQPIEYALFWRGEPLFKTIAELQPLDWSAHVRDGLPLLLLVWAVLAVWRWRARGFDVVEIAGGLAFTAAAISSQRFLGIAAVFAAPFLARDATEWASRFTAGGALRSAWTRGALAAAACLLGGIAEWTRPELPLGIALDTRELPVAACDFVARHGVRGRALNDLHLGGYLLWRFWPERDRLPFITTQPENASRADRDGYAAALVDEEGWRGLEARRDFEWVLLDRNPSPGEKLLESVANDPRFVPVFMDDAAIVFVRTPGRLAAVADSFAYRVIPADLGRRKELIAACERDSTLRALATREFARESSTSPANALSEQALGVLALMDGRPDRARPHLERALELKPDLESARKLLEQASGGK